jgi:hypothetical protein
MSENLAPPDLILPPNLDTLLLNLRRDIFANINCVQIGKVTKITSAAQTVEVQIQILRLAIDGSSVSYPVLVDCPYFVLQGGGAYIDMPISIGDGCILLFNDRDIDNWFSEGIEANPNTTRKHSLSDALAIVGINPSTKVLAHDGTLLRIINPKGEIQLGTGALAAAAREGDTIVSNPTTDPTNFPVLAALASMFGMSLPSLGGKISSGSSQVQIGSST